MSGTTTNICIRVDTELKSQAETLFSELGMNLTTAVTVFLRQAVRESRIPFEIKSLQPLMIIECKAETVPLTQKTLDQAITYNRKLNVPYLILHNGPQTLTVAIDGNSYHLTGLPRYSDLLRSE